MPLTLTRQTMLRRMLAADPSADGRFLTGVTSTGIYCLPSCRARKPKPQHVVFHDSVASARAAGLRPCQRCRPDDFYARLHTYADEARIDDLLAQVSPQDVPNVAALARRAGVSGSTLHRLFRVHLHTTPADWLTRQRVHQAQRRLLETSRPVAEIAFQVGFESLSAFGEQFRRLSALTPQAYRTMPRGQALTLKLPANYPTAATLRDLGRDRQQVTARVEGQTYTAALHLPSGPAVIRVDFAAHQATCTPLQTAAMNRQDWAHLHGALVRLLGLHADPARFEAQVSAQSDLAPLLEGQRGLRVPLYADLFDALVWAILGQQVTFSYACTLRRRLIQLTGSPLANGLYAPATAPAVAALAQADLVALGLTRARAALLLNVAGQVQGGHLNLAHLASGRVTQAERALLALPGIGPWTAQYVLLRAFGVQDAAPVGDSALADELQHFFKLDTRPDHRQAAALMARFSPYRSLATLHFWQRFARRRGALRDPP